MKSEIPKILNKKFGRATTNKDLEKFFIHLLLTIPVILFLVFYSPVLKAQDAKNKELKVKTSAVCGMCKETIETALAFEKGIKKSNLDVKSQIITILYNSKKTSPEKIRIAISNTGYDADELAASPKAYNKLSACCKKDNPIHEE